MTDTRDKIIEQLQRLAVLHFLADPDMPDGSDPVIVLANARKALGADTWETIEEAAERVGGELDEATAKITALEKELAGRIEQEIARAEELERRIAALERERDEATRDASAPIEAKSAPAVIGLERRIVEAAKAYRAAYVDGDKIAQARASGHLVGTVSDLLQAEQERAPWPSDAEDLSSKNTPPKGSREGGIDSPEALRESVRIITRQRDEAQARLDAVRVRAETAEQTIAQLRLELVRATSAEAEARQERDAASAQAGRLGVAHEAAKTRTERAEQERDTWRELATHRTKQVDDLRAEIEGLATERDGLRAELAAAIRPDGWECSLTEDDLGMTASGAYARAAAAHLHYPAIGASALAVRDVVLANLRRKATP